MKNICTTISDDDGFEAARVKFYGQFLEMRIRQMAAEEQHITAVTLGAYIGRTHPQVTEMLRRSGLLKKNEKFKDTLARVLSASATEKLATF